MIHIFIGTKAQLIKMAPIMRELKFRKIKYNFIFSGQHQDTIDELLQNFQLDPPDFTLYTGKDVTSPFQAIIWGIKTVIHAFKHRQTLWQGDKAGVVLNHGDTFSTLLGSLLAKLHGHKSAHVESGLRSHNFFHPFPEELTRVLVFRCSDIYYCPGEWAINNLRRYRGEKVNTVANTLYDTLHIELPTQQIDVNYPKETFGLVSLHRFENIFHRKQLIYLVDELIKISEKFKLLFILHKPTKKQLVKFHLLDKLENHPNIELRPRYDYFKFITLVKASSFVITDGGSNQEECSYLGKPCLVMRKHTERQEGIGKNVTLSKFDHSTIEKFIAGYSNKPTSKIYLKESPSNIIVDHLFSLNLTLNSAIKSN
jgi:UDP-N-acetylglucosamine 2-epimerase (non-hydrolysing)